MKLAIGSTISEVRRQEIWGKSHVLGWLWLQDTSRRSHRIQQMQTQMALDEFLHQTENNTSLLQQQNWGEKMGKEGLSVALKKSVLQWDIFLSCEYSFIPDS